MTRKRHPAERGPVYPPVPQQQQLLAQPVPPFPYPQPAPAQYRNVMISMLTDKHATVAMITYDNRMFTGSAKREPGDVHDPVIAEELAVARALRRLARELDADARERVRKAEEAKARTALRQKTPARHAVLTLAEIHAKYGSEAAKRAARRRGAAN